MKKNIFCNQTRESKCKKKLGCKPKFYGESWFFFYKKGSLFSCHMDIAYHWAIIHGMDIIIFICAQNYDVNVVLVAFKYDGEWEYAWATITVFDNKDNNDDDDLFHQFACRQNTTFKLKSILCNRMWIVAVVGHVGQRLFSLLKWIQTLQLHTQTHTYTLYTTHNNNFLILDIRFTLMGNDWEIERETVCLCLLRFFDHKRNCIWPATIISYLFASNSNNSWAQQFH